MKAASSRAGEWKYENVLKKLKPTKFDEKYLIEDRNGQIIKMSENLNRLIDKTNWDNLKVIK